MMVPGDYEDMTIEQARALKPIVWLPYKDRCHALKRLADQIGPERLAELFAAFIGLANSVVNNNKFCIELFGIVSGDYDPSSNEEYNLPTIFGALNGIELAASIPRQRGLCHGCAYRLGTPANQSPITTEDADYLAEENGRQFWCHEHVDENGKPTRVCGGHKQRTRKREGQEREREANV